MTPSMQHMVSQEGEVVEEREDGEGKEVEELRRRWVGAGGSHD